MPHSSATGSFRIAAALAVAALAALTGCSTTNKTENLHVSQFDLPAALRPPADQSLQLVALATGIQIYACAQRADSTYEWVFRAPEASLTSPSGQPLGKHYAGPTWELSDGSKVTAAVQAKDAGPDPHAIPWLLLGAKTNTGPGMLATTKSIQRVETVGGAAPTQPCDEMLVGKVARVPYTATYFFFGTAVKSMLPGMGAQTVELGGVCR